MLTPAGHRAVLAAVAFLALGALAIAVQGGATDGERAGAVRTAPRSTTTVVTSDDALGDDGGLDRGRHRPPASPPGRSGRSPGPPASHSVRGTGSLVTYTVEVEDAVGYSADEFARIVDATLVDRRGWTADGSVSFQRVADGGQVRVVLATPGTVDGLCAPLQTNGRYSCHQGGTVALNSDRWLNGADEWPGPLDEFRHYAVNHEMGHAIGHGHAACGGAGELAPVMMQQSKGLEGCLPNGWPFP